MEKVLTHTEFIQQRDASIRKEFQETFDPEIHKIYGLYKRIGKKHGITAARVEQIINAQSDESDAA